MSITVACRAHVAYNHRMNTATSPAIRGRIGPHSRVLARGSLGGKIDGRSREGRFLRAFEADLLKQLPGPASAAQALLVRRASRAALRLELMDEEMMEKGEISAHAGRVYGALGNNLRLALKELGIKPPAPPRGLTLADYIAAKTAAKASTVAT